MHQRLPKFLIPIKFFLTNPTFFFMYKSEANTLTHIQTHTYVGESYEFLQHTIQIV